MSEREPKKNEIIFLAYLTGRGSRRRDILSRREGYDRIDLYQIHECHISTKPTQKCGLRTMATPALGPILLLRTCAKGHAYVYVDHGIRYAQRVLRARLRVIPRSYAYEHRQT